MAASIATLVGGIFGNPDENVLRRQLAAPGFDPALRFLRIFVFVKIRDQHIGALA